jgi:hypothetical protein
MNTFDADQSMEDLNTGTAGTTAGGPKTNNFFTTDSKEP